MEIRNAQIATKIRGQFLEALDTMLEAPTSKEAAANLETAAARMRALGPDTLRLIKDSEDRGLGAPKASVDLTNADGSLTRRPTQEEVTAYLRSIHASPKP